MILDKAVDDISDKDLEQLIVDAVSEQKTIEYKRTLPGDNHESKKEFLADVSSLANSVGGYILFGIKEEDGLPFELLGIESRDYDHEILRLESLLREGIQPRIQGVLIRTIKIRAGNSVIIIRIPDSWSKPHVVNYQGHWRFYARNSAGKYPLDALELKSAFLATTALGERIRNFHFERINKITSDDTPLRLSDKARIILHTIPYSAFESGSLSNIHLLEKDMWLLNPIHATMSGFRYNLDGWVTYSSKENGIGTAYLQIFRNGIIESVNSSMFRPYENQHWIPTIVFEEDLIKAVQTSITIYQKLSIAPPFVIMLSLTGVLGYKLAVGNKVDPWKEHINSIDRNSLYLPEVIVEDFSISIPAKLHPIFDAVWNSAGWQKSLGYDEEGEWGKGHNFS